MSWDDAYRELEQELGREPSSSEVQERMLKMVESKTEREQHE